MGNDTKLANLPLTNVFHNDNDTSAESNIFLCNLSPTPICRRNSDHNSRRWSVIPLRYCQTKLTTHMYNIIQDTLVAIYCIT